MQKQNDSTLQQQLGLCAEIESKLFTLSQSVKLLEKEIRNEKHITPTRFKPPEPYKDSIVSLVFEAIRNFIGDFFHNFLLVLLCFFFAIPIAFLILSFIIDFAVEIFLGTKITFDQAAQITFYLLIVILAIVALVYIIREVSSGIADNKTRKQSYEYLKTEYEKEEKYCIEHNRKSDAKKSTFETMINRTMKTYNQISNSLKPLYEDINIPLKYRNFIAITTIYDYFICDRVDTLREAFNMYEQELRLNTIITKLDDIADRLDSIQDTQSLLYNEIINSNNKIESFMKDLDNKLSKVNNNLETNNQISNSILEECELNSFNTSLLLYSNEKLRESLSK